MASSRSYGKPFLEMIIEPENKFRFRYKCESEKSSHGAILGKRSDTDAKEAKKGTKKIYPTVKLINYGGKKPVSIRVSLYTKDQSQNHVLELKGVKNDVYLQDLNADNTAVFKNLAIINKKQDEVFAILLERKIKELGVSDASARRQIQVKSRSEFKEWMTENLDSVVLCFEAVYRDNPSVSICREIFSDLIKNQKSSLRITRMSHCSGSCDGGQEVILLCDKVKKDVIKIIFSDGNDDDPDSWRDEGEFEKVDVHHQVAITFKTPPYKKYVERTVNVYLQQEDERSESVEFTYIPDSGQVKKRKRNDTETHVPSYQSNLHLINAISPSSSSHGTSSDNCMYEPILIPNENGVCDSEYFTISTGSSSDNCIYEPSVTEKEDGVCDLDYFASKLDNLSDFLLENPEMVIANSSNSSEETLGLGITFDPNIFNLSEEDIQDEPYQSPFESHCPIFDMQIEGTHALPSNIDGMINSSEMHEDRVYCQSTVIEEYLLDDLRKLSLSSYSSKKSLENHSKIPSLQKCDKRSDEVKRFFEIKELDSTLQKRTSNYVSFETQIRCTEKQMSDSSIVKNSSKEKEKMNKKELKNDFNSKLREKVSHLLSEKDKYGNTLLHLVLLQNKNVSNILKMNKFLLPSDSGIVNVQNFKKQTPIHLATEKNNWKLIRLLLRNGADPNIKNADGNNCYHIASQNNSVPCLRELFCYPNLSGVNEFNYEGLSPLHIAITKNSVECFYLLIIKGNINAPDKKSSRTSLHHAVKCSLFVGDLLNKDDIDVNCQDFSGNTPLHIACGLGNVDIVKQLLEAGANPLLKNFEQNLNMTEVENSENEMRDGQTPLEVATNPQVLEIMKKYIQNEDTYLSDSDQSDYCTDASDVAKEKRMSDLLDGCLKRTDWEKVVQYIDLDNYLDTILKCNTSPTMGILSVLKKSEENYIQLFQNAIEISGVTDADVLKSIKEI